MIMPRDCTNFNMSRTECEIYHAMQGCKDVNTLCGMFHMTRNQLLRIATSIERKLYLTKQQQTKRAENDDGKSGD